MFTDFSNLNIKTKWKKIISLCLTLIGIMFILASNYIGYFVMRLSMVAVFILCLLNFKMTYNYSNIKEKINHLIGVIGSVLVFVKPQLLMLIIAAVILYLTLPIIYKAISTKDFYDKIMFIISFIGILFSIYCIINMKAALNTVVIIIGIAFVVVGCLIMYDELEKNKKIQKKNSDCQYYEQEEFGFEEVE